MAQARNLSKYILLIVIFVTLYNPAILRGQNWEFQTIDSMPFIIGNLKACTNSLCQKYVLYASSPMRNLIIYKLEESVWRKDSIQIRTNIDDVVADNLGSIYISATSGIFGYTKLACINYSESGVLIDTAFSIINGTILGTAMVLDENNYPHISASLGDTNGVYLLYCYKDQSGWHSEVITQLNAYDGYTDIEIADNGDIVILSANPNHYGHITCARKHQNVWNTQIVYNYQNSTTPITISLNLLNGLNPSIAFHITNPTGSAGSVLCMDNQDSGWEVLPSLDSVYKIFGFSPYLISNGGMRNLGFYTHSNLNNEITYYYAYYFPILGVWQYELVDSFLQGIEGNMDMVKDSLDNIFLFFKDNLMLKVGTRLKPSYVIESLPTSDSNFLKIFPNPSNNAIKIELKDLIISGVSELRIYNLLGQLVYCTELNLNKGYNFVEVNFSKINPKLSSGQYYLNLRISNVNLNSRFSILK